MLAQAAGVLYQIDVPSANDLDEHHGPDTTGFVNMDPVVDKKFRFLHCIL